MCRLNVRFLLCYVNEKSQTAVSFNYVNHRPTSSNTKILQYSIALEGFQFLIEIFQRATRSKSKGNLFEKDARQLFLSLVQNVDSQSGIITRPCADVDLLNVRDESAEGGCDSSILCWRLCSLISFAIIHPDFPRLFSPIVCSSLWSRTSSLAEKSVEELKNQRVKEFCLNCLTRVDHYLRSLEGVARERVSRVANE